MTIEKSAALRDAMADAVGVERGMLNSNHMEILINIGKGMFLSGEFDIRAGELSDAILEEFERQRCVINAKTLTVAIQYPPEYSGEVPGIGKQVGGGTVTAMSVGSLFELMEIAQEALENSSDDDCIGAAEEIQEIEVRRLRGDG